ncbi:MAG: Na/Pi symporter [gamma proteobacterium symbiont of Bathyaustriella thionipta]|nr:Na/Pi symporter [gamma proteobacterium symbiont of Bathyaustriella thionipta]
MRKILLPVLLVILGYGFWISPEFKTIAAGVAVFLIGMMALEQGFKSFSGGVLENFLHKTTDTLFKSHLFGLLATSIMQSSSLVSVITISFISAGLIGLTQGIGIIFGANLGTTTGAWLVAGFGLKVDIAAYAMPMLVFGAILMFQKNSKVLRGSGWVLIGMGFLFLGIAYMKEGFDGLSGQLDLSQYAMPGLKGVLIYTAIGIGMTVVMQSSHATLILSIAALAAGQISYENALALAIGSNVGTTVTAVVGALGANAAGRRLAGAHLIFNLATGAVAIVFLGQFMLTVDWLSSLVGIEADNYTLKFAVFHTLFNLLGVMMMLPLINMLVIFLERSIKDKVEPQAVSAVLFLNNSALQLPDTALEVISKELVHMANNTFEILAHALNLNRADIMSLQSMDQIVHDSREIIHVDVSDVYARKVKGLYAAIIDYATRAEVIMDANQLAVTARLRSAAHELVVAIKAMKDMQKNLDRAMASENKYFRHEYDEIRMQLGNLLRLLFSMEENSTISGRMLALQEFRYQMEEHDIIANGVLDDLIRKQLISPEMATSLMNDSAFAYEIQKNLISVEEAIYEGVVSTKSMTDLDQENLEQKLISRRSEIYARLDEEKLRMQQLGS